MIDQKMVNQIAKLARLHLTDEECAQFSQQLASALDHFDNISQISTQGIEPLVTPTEIQDVLREDNIIREFSTEELLRSAPDRMGHLFKVPPVV